MEMLKVGKSLPFGKDSVKLKTKQNKSKQPFFWKPSHFDQNPAQFGIVPTINFFWFFSLFPQLYPAHQTVTMSSALAPVTSPVLPWWAPPAAAGGALRGVSVTRGLSSMGTPACHPSTVAASTGDAISRSGDKDRWYLRLGTGRVCFLGIRLGIELIHLENSRGFGV